MTIRRNGWAAGYDIMVPLVVVALVLIGIFAYRGGWFGGSGRGDDKSEGNSTGRSDNKEQAGAGAGAGAGSAATVTGGDDGTNFKDGHLLKLITDQSPVDPFVTFRLVFKTGSSDDKPGSEGLTWVTARMLAEGGAGERSYTELLDYLYPMAATIDIQVDREMTVFSGRVHRNDAEKFADVLADMLISPVLAEDALKRIRSDALTTVRNRLRWDSDEELGKAAMMSLMAGRHPYGHPVVGVASSLEKIESHAVRRHIADVFGQDRLTVGISGGYPPGLPERLAKRLSALPASRRPWIPVGMLEGSSGVAGLTAEKDTNADDNNNQQQQPTVNREAKVLIVDKDTPSVAISVGFPLNISRTHKDFAAMMVIGSHLGEHRMFNGLLMKELRVKRGLNYGDYAYVEAFRQEGSGRMPMTNIARTRQHFEIWIRPVPGDAGVYSLRLALHLLEQTVRDGLSVEEFETTRAFLKNQHALLYQTRQRQLGHTIDCAFYNDPLCGDDNFSKAMDALTLDDVNRVLKERLGRRHYSIGVVTGDPEGFIRELTGTPEYEPVYKGQVPADVVALDAEVAKNPFRVTRDQIVVKPAATMFE